LNERISGIFGRAYFSLQWNKNETYRANVMFSKIILLPT